MVKQVFLLFPIHLFEKKFLPFLGEMPHFLIEEPIYFGDREKKYNFNQLKLVLHRASMKYYEDYLGNVDEYIEYKDLKGKKWYPFLTGKGLKGGEIHTFDPTDRLLVKKLKGVAKAIGAELVFHDTPNFLTPAGDLVEFIEKVQKGKKKYIHSTFYNWQKKRMKISELSGVKSQDASNRDPIPKGVKIPPLPKNDSKTEWVKEAQRYVGRLFGDNYGNLGNDTDVGEFPYPVTHKTSEAWFRDFLRKRLKLFGKYQDAITSRNEFLFHSVITPMLNIGLLDPQWIVDETTKYYKSNKSAIKMNNYEGFIRQVIGWREYSRMLYHFQYEPIKKGNYFGNKRKLSAAWYRGTTGILPVDSAIKAAFRNGYLHHIQRLMIMSNFMNLCRLHPDEVYRWFMEFSVDSYDWVMTNNVYSMGLYADGGLTMTKPYLSTNNYVEKMSDYKKDGSWDVSWRALYYAFMGDNYSELKKTAMVRNLGLWDRLSSSEKADFRKEAKSVIKRITKAKS